MKRASLVASWVPAVMALLSTRAALADEEPAAPVTIQVAEPAKPAEAPVAPPASTTWRTDLWKISAGPRFSYVTSGGFDAFSKNDVLPAFALEGQYPLFSRGNLAVGVGLGYVGGARSASVRGQGTALGVHTFHVPIEGRYHLGRWPDGFLHVAPGDRPICCVPHTLVAARSSFTPGCKTTSSCVRWCLALHNSRS